MKDVWIRGCVVDDNGDVIEVSDNEAQFFGLYVAEYGLLDDRLFMWHSDYPTKEEAIKASDVILDEDY